MLSPRDLLSRVILQGPPKVKGRSCYLFNSSFPCHEEEGGSSFPGQDQGENAPLELQGIKTRIRIPNSSSPALIPLDEAQGRC